MSESPRPSDSSQGPAEPDASSIRDYLVFGLSLPERTLRSSASLVAGAIRESADLLVPNAFQDSKTYTILIKQTMTFLAQDIGGVESKAEAAESSPGVDNFVARKAVGNFVEMAGLATLHLSPMLLLAIVSDVAYGSTKYLHELTDQLKEQGVIAENSTIDHAGDLLGAISEASGVAASAFDTPPLSVDGIRATIADTTAAIGRIDPTQVIPEAEISRIWTEMNDLAQREDVGLLQLSGAMSLYSLHRMGTIAQGALSTVTVAGSLLDEHVLGHYRDALGDIKQRGIYASLVETSEPYIDAVWYNFSSDRQTITEDLVSGKLVGRVYRGVRRWLGCGDPPEETDVKPRSEKFDNID